MADRLADTRRFYDLLARLEARIGGKRKLADCNGSMNWPNRGIYFFCEDGEVRSSPGRRRRAGDRPLGARRAGVGAHEPGRVNDRRDARRELEDEPDGGALLGRGDR